MSTPQHARTTMPNHVAHHMPKHVLEHVVGHMQTRDERRETREGENYFYLTLVSRRGRVDLNRWVTNARGRIEAAAAPLTRRLAPGRAATR